jgi:alpha-ribazole phosphatase
MSKIDTTQHLRLYLIRHGEVEGATDGKLFGRTDAPLSERGLAQARGLAEKLAVVPLSAIYSSNLKRASLTAEHIAGRSGLRVQPCSDWREINMGEWEGRTIAALHCEEPELVARLFNDPASFEYPGGESFAAFAVRIQEALNRLLLTHPSGEVALIAHGGVCRTVIGSVLEMPMRNWLRLAQDYGCLNVIDWYGANPVLRHFNLYEGQTLSPSFAV